MSKETKPVANVANIVVDEQVVASAELQAANPDVCLGVGVVTGVYRDGYGTVRDPRGVVRVRWEQGVVQLHRMSDLSPAPAKAASKKD